jgi:hypothetical protein
LKAAPPAGPPAPSFWQTLHQQTRPRIGPSETVNRTAPQRHPPVIMSRSLMIRLLRSAPPEIAQESERIHGRATPCHNPWIEGFAS